MPPKQLPKVQKPATSNFYWRYFICRRTLDEGLEFLVDAWVPGKRIARFSRNIVDAKKAGYCWLYGKDAEYQLRRISCDCSVKDVFLALVRLTSGDPCQWEIIDIVNSLNSKKQNPSINEYTDSQHA